MYMTHERKFKGAPIAQFLSPGQLQEIIDYAKDPQPIESKLKLYDRLATDAEIVNPNTGHKSWGSVLGGHINNLFHTKLSLPSDQRRYQILQALKFGRAYLVENPDVSVYFAAIIGAAEEYREWVATVGDLQPEQQKSIVGGDNYR
jgi:hypothetical protein